MATSNQTVTGTINATGCDLGVYVGPGVTGVTIGSTAAGETTTVTGANDTGIFAEQTSGILVQDVTITANGINPTTTVESFGGVVLAGVSSTVVTGTTITNNGGGGVFLNDNGPSDPGASNAGPKAPVASVSDTVADNNINGNYGACGIVYSTHNSGGTISDSSIVGNIISGHPGVFKATGPDVGGIVIGAASPGATISNIKVTGNDVSTSFEGGIIVHSHAPHDLVTGTVISGNIVGPGNNWGQTNGPPTTAGIIVGVDVL
ncbi:MAG: hypothetical protein ACRDJU_01610, partial [Actinomycetota bacterium]